MRFRRTSTAAPLLAVAIILLALLGVGAWNSLAADEDTLRLAGPVQGPETLDPAQVRDLSSVGILRQIYRGLVYYDDNLVPVPELSSSYEISEDGLTYTFTLREGATFHDGSPVTADDVVFSLSRAVNPDTVGGDLTALGGPLFLSDIAGYSAVLNGESDVLDGVRALDDGNVEIELIAPRSTFLMKLAAVPAAIVDRDSVEENDTWWEEPNGSGPYRVESWEPGESLELRRYEDFVLGEPAIERVEFRLGTRALQSFNLYQSGQIDIDSVTLSDIDRVADPEGPFAAELIQTPQFGFGYLALNPAQEPLDDPKIREALSLAFPRTEIAEILFNGWVGEAESVIPNGMLGQDWPAAVEEQDLDAARQAIQDSGYGSANAVPPIRIYASGSVAGEPLRAVARDELGLEIEVFDLDWFDFLDRLGSGVLPAYELYWAADFPDPEAILLALWGTGQPDNYLQYSNPALDDVLASAAEETDPVLRASLYAEASQLLANDHIVIPVYMDIQYTVVKPRVRNLIVTPIGILRLETVRLES